jgi:CelD/BcsL family acetyltransferase involved in cellulose biosynthesis
MVPWDQVDWAELGTYPDRTLFQSREWLTFVAHAKHGEPRVIRLNRGLETLGYFTCLAVRQARFLIVGSPFKGWTTSYMGFNVLNEAVRDEALRGLPMFLFKQMGCVHVELMDRQIDPARARTLGLDCSPFRTYEINLSLSEPDLLAQMHTAVRRYIRRAARQRNVVIEECQDPEFAEDYYAQLQDVFARQGLVPTYSIARVRALMKYLLPSGNLLLLRARDRAGRCLATGIFPAQHGTMYFWGGASWRDALSEHPNEPLHWHAMMYWKGRGMTCYDMGGGGQYKANYGGVPREYAWIRQSRNRLIAGLRTAALQLFKLAQRTRGRRFLRAGKSHSGTRICA